MRKFQSQNNGKVKFRVGWASIKYNTTRVDCDLPDDIDLTLDDNDPSVSLTNFTYETLKSCYPNAHIEFDCLPALRDTVVVASRVVPGAVVGRTVVNPDRREDWAARDTRDRDHDIVTGGDLVAVGHSQGEGDHLVIRRCSRRRPTAIFEYLEIFHNRQRRHSSLGMRTPIEYETIHHNNQTAAPLSQVN